MRTDQLFLLIGAIYIAPNLSPRTRLIAASVAMAASAVIYFYERAFR